MFVAEVISESMVRKGHIQCDAWLTFCDSGTSMLIGNISSKWDYHNGVLHVVQYNKLANNTEKLFSVPAPLWTKVLV